MAQRVITKSLVVKGKIYTPGLKELTAEEEADLEKRGAFEGGPTPAEAPKAAPEIPAATNDQLEPIAARISGELGVARNEGETPLQFLQRFAGNAKSFIAAVVERADEKALEVGKELEAVAKERDGLRSELDALKAQSIDSDSSPTEPLSVLHPLGLDVVGELVAAGFDTPDKLKAASDDELDAVQGIGLATVRKIRELLG